MTSPIEQFRDAIQSAGLIAPADIRPDGTLRRFSSSGKNGDDSGWYVMHGDGIPAGSFGDWRTGISQSWHADIGRALSPQEEAAHRARIEAIPASVKPKIHGDTKQRDAKQNRSGKGRSSRPITQHRFNRPR